MRRGSSRTPRGKIKIESKQQPCKQDADRDGAVADKRDARTCCCCCDRVLVAALMSFPTGPHELVRVDWPQHVTSGTEDEAHQIALGALDQNGVRKTQPHRSFTRGRAGPDSATTR
jgi:hypothetical protein